MTFMYKQCTQYQCSNNTSRWMTYVFISYKPMKSKFCTTIITKLWPIKFVMLGGTYPWELNPFLVGGTKSFFPLRFCSIRQLNPFSLGEHGWDYHFISPSKKILFSSRHLAWRSRLNIFFHPFCSLKDNFFEKRIKAWTFWLKGEILTSISFFPFKILCKKNNWNVNHSSNIILKYKKSCWALFCNCIKINATLNYEQQGMHVKEEFP
jgi:hypothetical protein